MRNLPGASLVLLSFYINVTPFFFQIVKLDLNYLREVIPSRNGTLSVSLKFDLLRADRKKRMYLFEDIDDNIHVSTVI